jgi:NAD(P)-dependent dehydrogenase (short-subunit alcohol dehydrogenase family)
VSTLEGKAVLVTGSTDGIGRQTALELARMGARVLVHGRSRQKTDRVRDELRKAVPGAKVDAVVGDLAELAQVRALAREVESLTDRLHVLLHNAGVFVHERQLTPEGFETTFAVNHLAPFLLTHLLRPLLERAAPSRVVVVSSIAHQRGQLDFDNLQAERRFNGYGAYATSKLANVLFASALAERWAPLRITAYSLHPGVISTKLLKEGFGAEGDSVEEGARTSVHVASAPGLEELNGKYFVRSREATPSPAAQDKALRDRLWEVSEKLTGVSSAS